MGQTYFGTDGIRGTVGEAPMTPDFALHLGWAAGRVLLDQLSRGRTEAHHAARPCLRNNAFRASLAALMLLHLGAACVSPLT